jgi:hypothetical protein
MAYAVIVQYDELPPVEHWYVAKDPQEAQFEADYDIYLDVMGHCIEDGKILCVAIDHDVSLKVVLNNV